MVEIFLIISYTSAIYEPIWLKFKKKVLIKCLKNMTPPLNIALAIVNGGVITISQ